MTQKILPKKVKQDLTGQTFGLLTVEEWTDVKNSPIRGRGCWKTICQCGNTVYATTSDLTHGRIIRCKNCNYKDLKGQVFGRLSVIELVGANDKGQKLWLCECECGNTVIVLGYSLTRGDTKSCGCLYKEKLAAGMGLKHGYVGTRVYKEWQGMIARTTNPNQTGYHNYGGRGITVCEEWKKPEPFIEWSLKNGYDDTLTLDRIDVNGNYEPDNCRWIPLKDQHSNKRTNKILEYNNEIHTQRQWSEITGIPETTIRSRLRLGWTVEEALSIPIKIGKRISTIRKERQQQV